MADESYKNLNPNAAIQEPDALEKMGQIQIPGDPANNISVRQNNPFNLKHVGQEGSLGAGTRGFSIFETPEHGVKAGIKQIQLMQGRGLTFGQFAEKYAPAYENPTWAADVAKAVEVDHDTPINQIPIMKLARAVAWRESQTKIPEGYEPPQGVVSKVLGWLGPNGAEAAEVSKGFVTRHEVAATQNPMAHARAVMGLLPSQEDEPIDVNQMLKDREVPPPDPGTALPLTPQLPLMAPLAYDPSGAVPEAMHIATTDGIDPAWVGSKFKQGLYNLVVRAAGSVDPASALSGAGVDPNTPEALAMAKSAPGAREGRTEVAQKAVQQGMFPQGMPRDAKGVEEMILGGGAEMLPDLIMLLTGGAATKGIEGAGLVAGVARSAIPFLLQGLTDTDPVKGASHGALVGGLLGGSHFLGKKLVDPIAQWVARIAGGATIGGGTALAGGADIDEAARSALMFAAFDAMGLKDAVKGTGGKRGMAEVDHILDNLKFEPDLTEVLKTAPMDSPEFIDAMNTAVQHIERDKAQTNKLRRSEVHKDGDVYAQEAYDSAIARGYSPEEALEFSHIARNQYVNTFLVENEGGASNPLPQPNITMWEQSKKAESYSQSVYEQHIADGTPVEEAHRLADIAHDTFVQHLDTARDPEVRVEPEQTGSAVELGRPVEKGTFKPQDDASVVGDLRIEKTRAERRAQEDRIIREKLAKVTGGDPDKPIFEVTQDTVDQFFDIKIPSPMPGKAFGLNITNLGRTEQIRDLVYRTGEVFSEAIADAKKNPTTQAQMHEWGEKLGWDTRAMLSADPHEVELAAKIKAGQIILTETQNATLKAMRRVNSINVSDLDRLVFRRHLALYGAIEAELAGLGAVASRALNACKMPKTSGALALEKAITELMRQNGGSTTTDNIARQLAQLESGDPAAFGRIASKAWKATKWDMFAEYYVNGLLWKPTTHMGNIGGNIGMLSGQIAERRLAEIWSKDIAAGESMAMLEGIRESTMDALRLAGQALKDGPGADLFSKIETRGEAITADQLNLSGTMGRAVDLLGELIRIPGRALGAEDVFFKAIAYRAELHALSLRQSFAEARDHLAQTGEILTDAQIRERQREIINAPPEDLTLALQDFVKYVTFQNSLGDFGGSIQGALSRYPALKAVTFPFIRTPVNIFKAAMQRTPFAVATASFRHDIRQGGAKKDLALARISLGSATFAVIAGLVVNGMITGQAPEKPELREAWLRNGGQEYSFIVGGKAYAFDRFDPIGMVFGMAADITQFGLHAGEQDGQNLLWAGLMATTHAFVSKTYVRQLGTMLGALQDADRNGYRVFANIAQGLMPLSSAGAGIAQAIDPGKKEVVDPRWGGFQTFIESIKSRTPGPWSGENVPTARDRWGDKIIPGKLGEGWFAPMDYAARLASPVAAKDAIPSPVDAEMLKHQSGVAMPRRMLEGVQLHNTEYTRLIEIAGKEVKIDGKHMKEYLNAFVSSPMYRSLKGEGPDSPQMTVIRTLVNKFDEVAQYKLRAENKELDYDIKQAQREHRDKQYSINQGGAQQ